MAAAHLLGLAKHTSVFLSQRAECEADSFEVLSALNYSVAEWNTWMWRVLPPQPAVMAQTTDNYELFIFHDLIIEFSAFVYLSSSQLD